MLFRDERQRLSVQAALIILVVFVAGVAAGVGLSWLLRPPPPFALGRPDRLPPPYEMFDFEGEQLSRAREISQRHRAAMRSQLEEVVPKLKALRQEYDREMRAILTPDQRVQFDDFAATHPPPEHLPR